MDIISLGFGFLSGGASGLLIGHLMNSNMGRPARIITGVVGGTVFAAFTPMMQSFAVSLMGMIVSGAIGGGILTFIFTKFVDGTKG